MKHCFLKLFFTTITLSLFLIACGGSSGTKTTSKIPIKASTNNSTWQQISDLPTSISEANALTFEDKIYIIGGYSEPSNNKLIIFDPITEAFSFGADLPYDSHHPTSVIYHNKLYVFSGNNPIQIYEPTTDQWILGHHMPTTAFGMASGVIDDEIHIIGGISDLFNGEELSNHSIYFPETDSWLESEPMPFKRDHLGSAVIDNELILFGGRDNQTNKNHTVKWDSSNNNWQTLPALLTPRSGFGTATNNHQIFIIGGEDELTQQTSKTVEMFNSDTQTWEKVSDIPSARYGTAATIYKDTLYIFGGSPKSGFNQSKTVYTLKL